MTPCQEWIRRSECNHLQVERVTTEREGHFVAGFIEGEGHFGIPEANGGQSFRCLMSLRVRDDDADLVSWLRERTRIGRLRGVGAQATFEAAGRVWRVDTQAGCSARRRRPRRPRSTASS